MPTMEEYDDLLEDRPKKFSAEEVNFREAKVGQLMCSSCIHWYRGAAMEKDVCEVMRPKDEQVPWNWVCMFQTSDGEHFPLYQESKDENS